MIATTAADILAKIEAGVSEFTWLSAAERAWFAAHRILPRPVSLAEDSEGTKWEEFWLVTEHTGADDSSFRIVYDDGREGFGRECLLDTDVPLFLGVYPTLEDALDEIL